MDNNRKTLETYEADYQAYLGGTAKVTSGIYKDWIDKAIGRLPKAPVILEIGSAGGRDADYMESLGLSVERTDAAQSFVDHLIAQGHQAKKLNIVSDELSQRAYDMVFAAGVLLHLNDEQVRLALGKIYGGLSENGVLAFSVKGGQGEEWEGRKTGGQRYFNYWYQAELESELEKAGFCVVDVAISPGRSGHDWLLVIASKL